MWLEACDKQVLVTFGKEEVGILSYLKAIVHGRIIIRTCIG